MKKITHDLNSILLHTQSIVCATVDSQYLRVLGIYNFGCQALASVKFKRSHHDPICHMKDLQKWHFWSKTDTLWNSKVGKTRLKSKMHQRKKSVNIPCSAIFFISVYFCLEKPFKLTLHNGFKLILKEQFICTRKYGRLCRPIFLPFGYGRKLGTTVRAPL